jgi:hypothetical protein
LERVFCVTRLAAHIQVFLTAYDLHQPFAKNRVILDDEYLPAGARGLGLQSFRHGFDTRFHLTTIPVNSVV